MAEIAFLFGAGASKAADGFVKPCPPPIMSELYDELAKTYARDWGPGSGYEIYSDRFRKNFELTFTEVVLGITGDYAISPPGLTLLERQIPLALYFSRFILDTVGGDCFSKLLSYLSDAGKIEHTVFGSLNYECLFEQAAENLGLKLDYRCVDPMPDKVRVAKLHGSCNFITDRITQTIRAQLAATNNLVEVGLVPLPLANLEKVLTRSFTAAEPHLPVMSQLSRDKINYTSPRRNPKN